MGTEYHEEDNTGSEKNTYEKHKKMQPCKSLSLAPSELQKMRAVNYIIEQVIKRDKGRV